MRSELMPMVVLFLSCMSAATYADQFHYNNVIVGDRAAGLGGAFSAVADDASAIVYNPAGLAFALSNDISGSANAFYSKTVTYKDTIGSRDFTENSEGTLSPFFGALAKVDHISPGMVFAFGVYQPDSELKDQNDLIEEPDLNVVRFHRTANLRANTNKYGAAIAKRVGGSLAFGFGLNWVMIDELTQEYQDSTSGVSLGETTYLKYLTQNIREHLIVNAIEPVLGMQLALGGNFSTGLTLRKAIPVYQRREYDYERTVVIQDLESGKVIDVNDSGGSTEEIAANSLRSVTTKAVEDNPLGELPLEARLGFAWFASQRLMLAFDTMYYTETDGDLDVYDRDAVLNFALGGEFYTTPSFPVRVGFFTNNDARPEIDESKSGQRDHIDYLGMSAFVAYAQPNSQISIGTVLQRGTGKAQKTGGSAVQDVEAFAYNVGFSVSHNF